MPGLVDIHAHPATEIFYCDLREDHSVPEHYITGLCERFCYPGWLDVMARSGMRKFAAPTFETSRWYRDNVHQYKFEEDISKGEQAFAHALDVIEIARNHLSGRLDGVVAPSTIDKVLPDMLSESRAEASKRGFAWTTHTSQAVLEFNVMIERYGGTPVQFLVERDFFGRRHDLRARDCTR